MKNFFEHQDDAKRASKRLVGLFAAAVTGITLILYAGGVLLLRSTENAQGETVVTWWDPEMLGCVAIMVLVGVGGSALVRLSGLKGGGGAIAESLGGRIVEPDARRAGAHAREHRRRDGHRVGCSGAFGLRPRQRAGDQRLRGRI